MSLPVSQYEELLAEVRGLRRKAQRVQALATPLLTGCSTPKSSSFGSKQDDVEFRRTSSRMESFLHNASSSNYDYAASCNTEGGDTTCSEDECGGAHSTHMSVSSEPISHKDRGGGGGGGGGGISILQHGTWPGERTMWNSDPLTIKSSPPVHSRMQEVASVMSFASSAGGVPLDRVLCSPTMSRRSSQQLEAKVDMVYSLLAMLSGQEHADMGETLLALSTNPESCLAMRQSGCIPLLVQMVQSDKEVETRTKAVQALHNLIHSQPDEKIRKRETRIFKLLEHIRAYTEALKSNKVMEFEASLSSSSSEDGDKHPVQTVAHLMKLSFDEGHRQAICQLGGIHTIANLVETEHLNHGSTTDEAHCILMRRYACMALTNLTFGDSGNKALLCSFRDFIRALVVQLRSPSDELRQVTASVLRNLSWRADSSSKEILREVGSVTGLMKAAMLDNKENTLKSILSALWNLSAHCTENKSEICSVDGALGFLVDMLTYKTPSKSLAIIENSGGILRNISSQIAVRDDYRDILRQHNCLQVLLQQLKSPSLTIVSNACGTLWNLSAKCTTDQEALWQMGAPSMLRSLNHSKHKMIAMGSSAALKNLLSARPAQTILPEMDSTALAMDLPVLPTLGARKQKALLQDLDQTLSETYENIERDSPMKLARDEKAIPTQDDAEDVAEPSTSYTAVYHSSGSNSLPPMETTKFSNIPVRNKGAASDTTVTRKSFTKSMPKNVAKSSSSLNKDNASSECNRNDNESYNLYDDDCMKFRASNDKTQRNQAIPKEVTTNIDEKDHCSIEDISDADNPDVGNSRLRLELDGNNQKMTRSYQKDTDSLSAKNSSGFVSGFESDKELPHSSATNTVSEESIDIINIEDISIQLESFDVDAAESLRMIHDEHEKHDLEKASQQDEIKLRGIGGATVENTRQDQSKPETKSRSKSGFSSGIPLPKTASRPAPLVSSSDDNLNENSTTSIFTETTQQSIMMFTAKLNGNRLTSGLARHSLLQTSTPIKINSDGSAGNLRKDSVFAEDCQVRNNNLSTEVDNSVFGIASARRSNDSVVLSTTNLEYNRLLLSSIDDEPRATASASEEDHILMNFSVLNTPDPDMGNLQQSQSKIMNDEPNDDCLVPYLESDFRVLERSCDANSLVDNRMLDPDAMIESLDRFTAELVSQASHLQSKCDDGKYKTSANDDTWNEDTSPNEVTFPSISGSAPNVITFADSTDDNPVGMDQVDGVNQNEQQSNDFSSINTTSTMTESTLIAIEATKMATAFKNEAEMSHSIGSVASLELDQIQPPSQINSLSCSVDCTKSPKLDSRRKTFQPGLMVRRALNNSFNNGSSLESLENHSLSNLDQMHPPSAMADLLDMEGSITSVASLPSEVAEVKADFVINGVINKNNPIFNVAHRSHLNSYTDLENINPPSIFNEITDMCNSLADVPTEAICSETEAFEDCYTHVVEPPIQTEDDVTEFSDANSATPILSDIGSSSSETTPKRTKSTSKYMTSKQRRNFARDRYKTYTVAAEMVMKEEVEKSKGATDSTSDDFKTVDCFSEDYKSVDNSETMYTAPTSKSPKLTPRERRQADKTRFETRVVDEAITSILQQPLITEMYTDSSGSNSVQPSPTQSPVRTKLSIRRNFMQKRLENKERFKTQTLDGSCFSPELSASPPVSGGEQDLHFLVQREANLVLKSLRETKTSTGDELLDCETLSLVSNDDDSEHNSGSSINYRTYHKSWGVRKNNIPVIQPADLVNCPSSNLAKISPECEPNLVGASDAAAAANVSDSDTDENKAPAKPKIVKPEKKASLDVTAEESEGKGVRGRRKPLYSSKSNIGTKIAPKTLKPIKNMTSNLVKNVTSTLKSGSILKTAAANKQSTSSSVKPPPCQNRTSSGYGPKFNSPKTSPARSIGRGTPKPATKLVPPAAKSLPLIERQGTFTKEETATTKSKLPMPAHTKSTTSTKIPKSQPSSRPTSNNNRLLQAKAAKSADRANRNVKTMNYCRSTSAESREYLMSRKVQNSTSSHSLKNERSVQVSAAATSKKSSSNTSLNGDASSSTNKKQVTSKIASLWKKIEESKNKPVKKDTRVWIQPEEPDAPAQVILRNKTQQDGDPVKRISRLGSFIVMDETEDGGGVRTQQQIVAVE